METLNTLLKPVLADSFGGIMYNVANKAKYDTKAINAAWEALTQNEQHSANGIVTGAINFLNSK